MTDFFKQVQEGRKRRAEQLAAGSPEWADRFRQHVKPVQYGRQYGASKQTLMKTCLHTEAQYDSSRRWFELADRRAAQIEPVDNTDPVEAQTVLLLPLAELVAVGFLVGMITAVAIVRFW